MADSNIQTLDTVKPITLDEYQERTAHLQENTTSLLSTIADRQVQAAGLATQAASLASEVNAVAEQASLSFSKKTWTDTATSGTPITATELNRLENAISSLTTAVNNLQDSVSPLKTFNTTDKSNVTLSFSSSNHSSAFLFIDNNGASSVIFLDCMNSESKILAGENLSITFPNNTTAVIGTTPWSCGFVITPLGDECSISIA